MPLLFQSVWSRFADHWYTRAGLLAATYWATAVLGLQWATIDGAGSAVWPAAGVALAGLLLGGRELWPAIAVARLLAGIATGSAQPLWVELSIAVGNAFAALVAVHVLATYSTLNTRLTRMGDVFWLFLAGLIQAVVSALFGVVSLAISSSMNPSSALVLAAQWTTATTVGVLVVSPAILTWGSPESWRMTHREWLYLLVAVVLSVGAVFIVFISPVSPFIRTWHTFPILIWIALFLFVRGASISLLIVATAATWSATTGIGALSELFPTTEDRIFFAQQYSAVTALVILVLAATADERRAEEKIRASEERFRGVYENAPLGIAIADLEGRLVNCNAAYSRIVARPEQELLTKSFEDLIHPADRKEYISLVHQLVSGKIPSFEIKNRYLRPDGDAIWVHAIVSVLRNSRGAPTSIVVLVSDMTERKRSEEQIEFLLREVNHRAKNLLAVVQSIARQTARDARPENFADELSFRLQGLARSQDLIIEGAWTRVDLRTLVRSQLDHLVPDLEASVVLDGPPITLNPAAAQSIGMAVHELGTNALKYGALSIPGGRVHIRWELDRASGGFWMRWQEEGGPEVSEPKRRGFGNAVTTRAVAHAIHGTVKLDFPASGVTWRLDCPLSSIEPRPFHDLSLPQRS